jgi:DNA-binding transcriptional regulator PaaX
LRDPQLPDELLPGDWEGRAVRQLCRNIYWLIYAKAEEWLSVVHWRAPMGRCRALAKISIDALVGANPGYWHP